MDKKLYAIFVEFYNLAGEKDLAHSYRYCTPIECIKEKRLMEEYLIETKIASTEKPITSWDEDVLNEYCLRKSRLKITSSIDIK